jgi:hypothetical protein
MSFDKWSILGGMATMTALILVAVSYNLSILMGCWLVAGWLLMLLWFADVRAPSVILSWVLLAVSVLAFAQFYFFPTREMKDMVVPDGMRDFRGDGWIVMVMATALQVVGALSLMSKGFKRDRKAEIEDESQFPDATPSKDERRSF